MSPVTEGTITRLALLRASSGQSSITSRALSYSSEDERRPLRVGRLVAPTSGSNSPCSGGLEGKPKAGNTFRERLNLRKQGSCPVLHITRNISADERNDYSDLSFLPASHGSEDDLLPRSRTSQAPQGSFLERLSKDVASSRNQDGSRVSPEPTLPVPSMCLNLSLSTQEASVTWPSDSLAEIIPPLPHPSDEAGESCLSFPPASKRADPARSPSPESSPKSKEEERIPSVFGVYQPKEEQIHSLRHPQSSGEDENYLDDYRLEEWVRRHPDDGSRHIAKAISKRIERVDLATFKNRLLFTLKDLTLQMKGLDPGFKVSEKAVVMVEGMKSNKWVAELAYFDLRFKASSYFRLGAGHASNFLAWLHASAPGVAKKELDGKTIILMDDGSYSGAQICDHVKAILDSIQKEKLGVKAIGIAVPYMTNHALSLLNQLKDNRQKIGIYVGRPIVMETLADVIQDQGPGAGEFEGNLRKMWSIGDDVSLAGLALHIFQHKVPNYQSFPDPLKKGKIYNIKGKQIPMGKNGKLNGLYLVSPFIFNSKEPPYKQG